MSVKAMTLLQDGKLRIFHDACLKISESLVGDDRRDFFRDFFKALSVAYGGVPPTMLKEVDVHA